MNVHFGFSYIGLIFLLMLMIPNIIWAKNKPKGYDKYVKNENKILLIFERIGEETVTAFYEIYWLRYFKSSKTMKDMYGNFFGIPVAGATLPVFAFLLLGIYGKNIFLIVSTVILGIGHIGIHLNHRKESLQDD